MSAYALGYDAGHADGGQPTIGREVVDQILTVRDLSASISLISISFTRRWMRPTGFNHNYQIGLSTRDALEWKGKAEQFRKEALSWRDQKFDPLRAKAKARREENAALQERKRRSARRKRRLLARLQKRNPDLAAERAAHDETHKEKQSLHRFRVVATVAARRPPRRPRRPAGIRRTGRVVKEAADTIERGDLFTAFVTSRKRTTTCRLADALAAALISARRSRSRSS